MYTPVSYDVKYYIIALLLASTKAYSCSTKRHKAAAAAGIAALLDRCGPGVEEEGGGK